MQRGVGFTGREALCTRGCHETGRARGLAELSRAGTSPNCFFATIQAYKSCVGEGRRSSLRMQLQSSFSHKQIEQTEVAVVKRLAKAHSMRMQPIHLRLHRPPDF